MLTRKSRLLLTLAAAPLLVAACTDNTLTNPFGEEVIGTYQMTVYAGRGMPATYTIEPGDPEFPEAPNGGFLVVPGGTMVLNSNGTFIETNNFVIQPSGGSDIQFSFVSSGTWTLNGEDFHFIAPAQNNVAQRNITGTITENVNGELVINYEEANSVGGFSPYEYRMQ